MHCVRMDCHITTLDFAVVNEAGQLIKTKSVATGVHSFIEFVKTLPQPRMIDMEEAQHRFFVCPLANIRNLTKGTKLTNTT